MLDININIAYTHKEKPELGWITSNAVMKYSVPNEISIENVNKSDISMLRVISPYFDYRATESILSYGDFKMLMDTPYQTKGINFIFDNSFNAGSQNEVRFVLNDMSKVNTAFQFDVLPLKGKSKVYQDDYAIKMRIKDGSLLMTNSNKIKLMQLLENYGMIAKGLILEDIENILKEFIQKNYPPIPMPEIQKIELCRDKTNNIHCLYFALQNKGYGIENSDISKDEEDRDILELSFIACCSNKVIADIEIDISHIVSQYKYVSYDISKNKEEYYIYFYEFGRNEDDVEEVECALKYKLNKRG